MNKLTFGPNTIEYDLAGFTIAQVELAYFDVLNVGSWIPAFVDGKRVASKSKFVLRHGQRVVYVKVCGFKGSGRNLEDEVMQLGERVLKLEEAILGGNGRQLDDAASVKSPYLTAEEAVEYLRLPSLQSLYGLVERRRLKPLRASKRRYLFTVEMLDAFVRNPSKK